jgi:glutamate synthase domain-containing protein 1
MRGLQLLGWREVPVDDTDLGVSVKATEPKHRQIFVGKGKGMGRRRCLRAPPVSRPQR